ncbi:MAG: hypothetical protein AAB875_06340, partial [Patescibacteria group bacterium]
EGRPGEIGGSGGGGGGISTIKPITPNIIGSRFPFLQQPGISNKAISDLVNTGKTKHKIWQPDKDKIINMPIDSLANKLDTNAKEARRLKNLLRK